MNKTIFKSLFASVFFALVLTACNQSGTTSKQSYDGRDYDISLAGDFSLVATSKKVETNYSLTITGKGKAKDYEKKDAVPWNPIVKKINSVKIEEGIENIGDYFFNSLSMDYYILPSTVTSVGEHSFNKSATIYTYGGQLDNIENDVYYYSETKPTSAGKYFYIDNNEPCIWVTATKSFLFIGNSFTYRGTNISDLENPEVPLDFKKIATNLDIDVEIDSVVKGSHTLTKFGNPSDEMGAIVEEKLTTKKYDYVILQEQSTAPINNYNTFLTAVKTLKKRIDETQIDCQTILYETWGTPYNVSNDPNTYGKTVGEMEAKIRTAYENVGKETDCAVNYIGKAFTYAYETKGINIYADDNRHQGALGAYLSAACHLRSIFKVSVSNCTEYCDLPENECKALLSVTDKVI